MANDYLIYKWDLWFHMFDSKNLGKIRKEDAREEEELFAKLSHIEAERKEEVMKALDEFWDAVVFRGKSTEVTKNEFIDRQRSAYRENKDEFIEKIRKCYTTLFDIFDVSREGSITCDEFINGLKAFHHDDVALEKTYILLEKTYFQSYHPIDGKVPAKDLVDSWVKFVTCNDSTQRDYVKEALENGL